MKTLTVDTANYSRYFIAVDTAARCGMKYQTKQRLNCCKQYHAEIIAETPEQQKVLTMIANATFAHPYENICRQELQNYINEQYKKSRN